MISLSLIEVCFVKTYLSGLEGFLVNYPPKNNLGRVLSTSSNSWSVPVSSGPQRLSIGRVLSKCPIDNSRKDRSPGGGAGADTVHKLF